MFSCIQPAPNSQKKKKKSDSFNSSKYPPTVLIFCASEAYQTTLNRKIRNYQFYDRKCELRKGRSTDDPQAFLFGSWTFCLRVFGVIFVSSFWNRSIKSDIKLFFKLPSYVIRTFINECCSSISTRSFHSVWFISVVAGGQCFSPISTLPIVVFHMILPTTLNYSLPVFSTT